MKTGLIKLYNELQHLYKKEALYIEVYGKEVYKEILKNTKDKIKELLKKTSN